MTTSKEELNGKVFALLTNYIDSPEKAASAAEKVAHLITNYGIEAEQQGAVNAITRFKVARINHTMSTSAQEWETEFDTATKMLLEYISELTKLKEEK